MPIEKLDGLVSSPCKYTSSTEVPVANVHSSKPSAQPCPAPEQMYSHTLAGLHVRTPDCLQLTRMFAFVVLP